MASNFTTWLAAIDPLLPANRAQGELVYWRMFTKTATTTASALIASPLNKRRTVIVQNDGASAIRLGDASVTTGAGIRIEPNASLQLDLGTGVVLYVIATSGSCNVSGIEGY